VRNESENRIARNEQIFDFDTSNQNIFHDKSSEDNLRVGAFNIPGIGGVVSNVEELSLPDRNLSMTQPTPVPITNARIVNNDIVNAIPLEGFLLKFSNKCKIILVISLLLLTAIIILVVISILRSSNVTSDADLLAEKLKPFLTAISPEELEDNLLATSLAFDWLVNDSRFND
jgi:hypothetical protein